MALRFLIALLLPLTASAYQATLNWYIFENHGTDRSGSIKIKEARIDLPIDAAWFEWKCQAEKQLDGVLVNCIHGVDFVETKVYCHLPQNKYGRLMRLGRASNFVTFSARCTDNPEPAKVSKSKKSKKAKPSAAPEAAQPIPAPALPTPELAPPQVPAEFPAGEPLPPVEPIAPPAQPPAPAVQPPAAPVAPALPPTAPKN